MQTTIDLDEDVLIAAQNLARQRDESLGQLLSDLVRQSLRLPSPEPSAPTGVIPVLPRKPGARPVTREHVKELLESDL